MRALRFQTCCFICQMPSKQCENVPFKLFFLCHHILKPWHWVTYNHFKTEGSWHAKGLLPVLNQINLHRLISGRVVDTQYNYALRPRKEIQIFVALSTINFSLAIYFYYSLLARPVIQLFILQEVLIKITTQLLKRTLDVWNWYLWYTNKIKVVSKVFYKCLHGWILSLSSSSSFNYDMLVPACLPLNQTLAR